MKTTFDVAGNYSERLFDICRGRRSNLGCGVRQTHEDGAMWG